MIFNCKPLILVCGCLVGPLWAGDIPAGRQVALRALLTQDCGSCHGLALKGGLGPPLRPENLTGKSPAFLAAVILQGRPGTAMPPWRTLLNEAEAQWLADYLSTGRLP